MLHRCDIAMLVAAEGWTEAAGRREAGLSRGPPMQGPLFVTALPDATRNEPAVPCLPPGLSPRLAFSGAQTPCQYLRVPGAPGPSTSSQPIFQEVWGLGGSWHEPQGPLENHISLSSRKHLVPLLTSPGSLGAEGLTATTGAAQDPRPRAPHRPLRTHFLTHFRHLQTAPSPLGPLPIFLLWG